MNLPAPLIEQAFLSTLLTDSSIMGEITELIKPEEFYEPKNELIYSTLASLYMAGRSTDVITVVGELANNGQLDLAGGIGYLREIVTPTEFHSMGADPIGMAFLIREEARRRALQDAGQQITAIAGERKGSSSDDATRAAEQIVLDIVNQDNASSTMATVVELLPEVIQNLKDAAVREENAVAGIPSGFPDFDRMTGGFKPGQMCIIAARPAVGKSTLAVDFARNAAFLAGKTVLFFSLEMAAAELVSRILAAEARVEAQKMKSGDLDETDWMNVEEARARLAHGTFLIDDQPNTSLSRVRSVAMRQKFRPEGLDMIIIDYLGLMEIPSTGRQSDSRQTDISTLSRGIKLLAKELEVPVIILSQLNRKAEERQDGRPMVSDLRESGSLEQDADMVLLLHRPEAVDENNRPGEADLIVGKHRGGPTGKVPLTSMLAYCKFVPGQGTISRETEMISDGESGVFATTEDEAPW